MITYITRRLILLIPVLFGLTILVFAIARLLPGDPVALAAGPNASRAEIEAYAREFGLDQPVITQYWTYLKGLFSGDWGVSIFTRRPVLEDLRAYLPATLELVFAAMLIAVTVGIPAGLFAGAYRNRWPDYLTRRGIPRRDLPPAFFPRPASSAWLRHVVGLVASGRPVSADGSATTGDNGVFDN